MNNLEDFIRNNASHLDNEELPVGHAERFQKKLEARRKRTWKNWSVAAMILILVGLAFWTGTYFEEHHPVTIRPQNASLADLSDVSPQMAQVESYFDQQISFELNQVKSQKSAQSQSIQQSLQMLDKLDKEYQQLRKELAVNFGDQRVINAMIVNYQARLTLLQTLLKQIKTEQTKLHKS